MQTTIRKWGNSQGLCIPKSYLRELNWRESDNVNIMLQGDTNVIQKIKPQNKKAAAFEQLKSLRIHVDDFDMERERDLYLEEKYGL